MLTKRSLITIEAMRNAPQLKLVPKSVFNVVFCKLVFTTSPPALSKGEGAGVCSLNVICEIGVGPHPPPSPREREPAYANAALFFFAGYSLKLFTAWASTI